MCDNSHLLIVLSPGGNSPKQGTDLIEPLADMLEMAFGVQDIWYMNDIGIYIYIYIAHGAIAL